MQEELYALKFIRTVQHKTHENFVTTRSLYLDKHTRTQIHTYAKGNCLAMSRLCSKFLTSNAVLNFSNNFQ
jgi:hypothetical protein